jgi:hypothetical protein
MLMLTAEQLAEALGARRSGRQWKCRCIVHEDRNPSMMIFDGREAVQVRCMAGCDPADIIAVLKARGLWSGDDQQDDSRRLSVHHNPVSQEAQKRDRALKRMREIARNIFAEAAPIEGTLAQRYFEQRDLWSVARMVADIRYHPSCPRAQYRSPAVVMAMRGYDSGVVLAIQRIFLTRAALKDGTPMMLGSPAGAAMQLQRLQDGNLHICEGLENGLSVVAMDYGPVWALGSASLIRSFPVLDSVTDLTIWGDHDPVDPRTGKRPGLDASEQCQARWRDSGRQCRILKTEAERKDANDAWRDRVARL